jgi:hypothetical protein
MSKCDECGGVGGVWDAVWEIGHWGPVCHEFFATCQVCDGSGKAETNQEGGESDAGRDDSESLGCDRGRGVSYVDGSIHVVRGV